MREKYAVGLACKEKIQVAVKKMENSLLFPEDLRAKEALTGKACIIFKRKTCRREIFAFNNRNDFAESPPGLWFGGVYSGSLVACRFDVFQGYGSKRTFASVQ